MLFRSNSPAFVIGGAYNTNDYVVNMVNNIPTVYQCTVGGWCSQTGLSTAYIPGTGWAWQQAWVQIATCLIATTNINKETIRIQPNPFYSQFSIDKGSNDLDRILVTNAIGQVIFDSKFSTQTLEVNTETWLSGVYFIRLAGKEGHAILKIVK